MTLAFAASMRAKSFLHAATQVLVKSADFCATVVLDVVFFIVNLVLVVAYLVKYRAKNFMRPPTWRLLHQEVPSFRCNHRAALRVCSGCAPESSNRADKPATFEPYFRHRAHQSALLRV